MSGVSLASLRLYVTQRNHALGLSFVVCVAVIWVAASFVVQDLVNAGLDPFLLTYIANSLFIALLPLSGLAAYGQKPALEAVLSDGLADKQLLSQNAGAPDTDAPDTSSSLATSESKYDIWLQTLGHKQLRHAALVVAPIWFAAQLTFNFSLSMTNITSNTILSSTSSLFTFGLSCVLLEEKFTKTKLVSIVGCIIGIALVTFGDRRNNSGKESLAGDILCLLSSMFYAAYTVAIRKMLPADRPADVSIFFGFIGMLNLIGMAPILLVLWLTSTVHAQGVTARLIALAVCKGLFDNVLSDYLWARAVLLIGPTLATVGLSVQVPLAVSADLVFRNPPWFHSLSSVTIMLCGAVAVLGGFLGVTLSMSQSSSTLSQLQARTSDEELTRVDTDSEA